MTLGLEIKAVAEVCVDQSPKQQDQPSRCIKPLVDLPQGTMLYTEAAIEALKAEIDQLNETAFNNFEAANLVSLYMIEAGLLQTNHKGDGEAVARNIIDSISCIVAKCDELKAQNAELKLAKAKATGACIALSEELDSLRTDRADAAN
ncbi:hypothetical protein ACI2KR_06475 [Pseudomonas luteola]